MSQNRPTDEDSLRRRIAEMGADTRLSRGEATLILAVYMKWKVGDTLATVRKRIGTAIDRASSANSEEAVPLKRGADRRFLMDDLVHWARWHYRKTRLTFEDLPSHTRVSIDGSLKARIGVRMRASGVGYPGNLKDCQDLIGRLYLEIAELKDHASRREVERKRDLAARFKKK